jgi:hypothetical protein
MTGGIHLPAILHINPHTADILSIVADTHISNILRVGKGLYLLLAGMLVVDLVFIVTTLFHDWHRIDDVRWSTAYDGGYPEIFMYAQELALIFLCVVLWRSIRQSFAWVWMLIFVFLFVDDAFMMHEKLGAVFAEWSQIETQGTMRGQDYGEMVAWAPFLILFPILVLISHLRSEKLYRLDLWVLYVLAASMVGLGVALDILSRLYNFWGHANIVGGIEDGGEMVIISLMLVHVFSLVKRNRPTPDGASLAEPV